MKNNRTMVLLYKWEKNLTNINNRTIFLIFYSIESYKLQ